MTAAFHIIIYDSNLLLNQILAYASRRSTLSEKQAERIQSSGLGMIAKWTPQQFILNHPVLHPNCLLVQAQYLGFYRQLDGSFRMEVLIVLLNLLRVVSPCKDLDFLRFTTRLGIYPFCRIFWPINGDQPYAAAHVTENLHAGFELFQVRSGDGLRPVHRNGVTPAGTREAVGIEVRQTIDLCRGEKGQEIRSNAEKLKVRLGKALEEDGAARQELHKFLRMYAGT